MGDAGDDGDEDDGRGEGADADVAMQVMMVSPPTPGLALMNQPQYPGAPLGRLISSEAAEAAGDSDTRAPSQLPRGGRAAGESPPRRAMLAGAGS